MAFNVPIYDLLTSSFSRAEQTVLGFRGRRLETVSQPEMIQLTRALAALALSTQSGRMPSQAVVFTMKDLIVSS